MSAKTIKITGWAITIVLGLLLGFSAFLKLTQNEGAIAQAASLGIDADTYRLIGVVELVSLLLFLIPRTGVIGGLLLVAYMGGAIASHLQHGQPIAIAVAVQVLLWIAITLRFPEIKQRLLPVKSNHS